MDILFDVASVSLQKEFVMVIEKEDGERGCAFVLVEHRNCNRQKKKKMNELINTIFFFRRLQTITIY